jgi:hypothetical protein
VKSTSQDDVFQEVKRHKRHISNNTSQTAKKLTKPVPTSTAVKLLVWGGFSVLTGSDILKLLNKTYRPTLEQVLKLYE